MSHPLPGHDYSEQTRGESNKEYKKRRGAHYNAHSKVLENAKVKGSGVKGHLQKLVEASERMKRSLGGK